MNGTIFGQGGIDTVIATNNRDFTLSDTTLTRSGLNAITLEINQNQTEQEVRMTIPLLTSLGY